MIEAIKTQRQCAFCEKYEWHVSYLIAGPTSFICNECVGAAGELLAKRNGTDGATEQVLRVGVDRDKFTHAAIRRHFHPATVADIVTSTRVFPIRMRPDLQKALDQLFADTKGITFYGIHDRDGFHTPTFSVLLDDTRSPMLIAPPRYEEVDVGDHEPVKCLENGLWLVEVGAARYAVFLSSHKQHGERAGSQLEIAVLAGAEGNQIASKIFKAAEDALKRAQSYRGKVLSLEVTNQYSGQAVGVTVHRLESVQEADLVLPASTVQLLRRNVVEFAKQRSQLSHFNMSLKKGLLFYGPPGTGKSYTIRYLATQLPGHTTLLVTAEQIGLIGEYVTLARLLQPSIVVIEDADLIARQRTDMSSPCEESMLNRLLNEMDGLTEDAEIIFILTTNRPEMIEPAVAGRPGRIDQAIEFPLPDEANRKKLAQIYAKNVPIPDELLQTIAVKTKNVSAAFIKELMRRATQFYVEKKAMGQLSLAEIDEALNEMLFTGGRLNIKLLGGDTAGAV